MPRMVSFHVYYCTCITVMLGFIQCMCLVVLIDYYYGRQCTTEVESDSEPSKPAVVPSLPSVFLAECIVSGSNCSLFLLSASHTAEMPRVADTNE